MKRLCRVCSKPLESSSMQCKFCRSWNPILTPTTAGSNAGLGTVLLSDVKASSFRRIRSGFWDTCLGGVENGETGIVTSSSILIGGQPGAGKSTLSLQIADSVAGLNQREVLYIHAEETEGQVGNRFNRMKLKNRHLIRLLPAMGAIAEGFSYVDIMRTFRPVAVVLDSVSKLVGKDYDMGVTLCESMKLWSVEYDSPSFIICHVNKDGDLAGLKAMEHAVDSCHMLSGENRGQRLLTSMKNRFGVSYDLIMKMNDTGLELVQEIRDDIDLEEEDEGEDDE